MAKLLREVDGLDTDAISEGLTRPLVEAAAALREEFVKAGWWGRQVRVDAEGGAQVVRLGSSRRIKTILRTNARTAYAAGRMRRQMENADDRPWWRYTAVLDSVTRDRHRALHGKVLRHDDPAWEAIYPPNGFNCRCRVVALTEEEARAAARLDVTGIEEVEQRVGVDMRTGEIITRPGTRIAYTDEFGERRHFTPDPGWSYRPGAALRRPQTGMFADPGQPDWTARGRPGQMPLHAALAGLAEPKNSAEALDTLRATYGVKAGGSRRVATPDGVEDVVIHDDMLRHIAEGEDLARVRYANRLLPTLEDPEEVWMVGYKNDRGDYEFRRHFIRGWDDKKATFTVVVETPDGWLAHTFIPMRKKNGINKRRLGALLYFRPEGEE